MAAPLRLLRYDAAANARDRRLSAPRRSAARSATSAPAAPRRRTPRSPWCGCRGGAGRPPPAGGRASPGGRPRAPRRSRGMVGVVVHHRDPGPLAEHLEAPRHPGEALAGGGEAGRTRLQLEGQPQAQPARCARLCSPSSGSRTVPSPATHRLSRPRSASRWRRPRCRWPAGRCFRSAVPQRPPPQPRRERPRPRRLRTEHAPKGRDPVGEAAKRPRARPSPA